METIDRRGVLFELDEIYKYKNLIVKSDRDVIRAIIYDGNEKANKFHEDFMNLVAWEIDHTLNKTSFKELKDILIIEMQQYLDSKYF